MKRIMKWRKEEKHFSLFLSSLLILPVLSFQDGEGKKTQAGEQRRQKQVSVSKHRGGKVDKTWLWEGEVGFGN